MRLVSPSSTAASKPTDGGMGLGVFDWAEAAQISEAQGSFDPWADRSWLCAGPRLDLLVLQSFTGSIFHVIMGTCTVSTQVGRWNMDTVIGVHKKPRGSHPSGFHIVLCVLASNWNGSGIAGETRFC